MHPEIDGWHLAKVVDVLLRLLLHHVYEGHFIECLPYFLYLLEHNRQVLFGLLSVISYEPKVGHRLVRFDVVLILFECFVECLVAAFLRIWLIAIV